MRKWLGKHAKNTMVDLMWPSGGMTSEKAMNVQTSYGLDQ
jgi:hypothetical protein